MLIGMLLFMSGAASVFVAAVLAARSLRQAWTHVGLLLGLAALSLVLYFSRERSPFWLALAATATLLWVVAPAVLAILARSQGRAGRLALARALCLARYGLTMARPALVQARIYSGYDLEASAGWEVVLTWFLTLRRRESSPEAQALVDTAYLSFALRRGDFHGALQYARAMGDVASVAGSQPEVAVLAQQAFCETGHLEEGAAVLRELAANHPERVGAAALLAAYTSFLRCAGDEGRLDALWSQAGRRAIVRSVPLPPGEMVGSPTDLPDIPWPPPLATEPGTGWRVQARSLSRSPVTAGLVAANLLVMGGLLLTGSPMAFATLINWGANASFLVETGQVWRWGSSVFLHFGALHIAMNMFALYVIGRLGEAMYGSSRLLLVYLVSGFAGSIVSTYVSAPPLSAGASGAISGLIGLGFTFTLLHGKKVSLAFRNRYLAVFLFIIGADLVYGFSEPMIDNAAHLGGLVAGGVATVLLAPRPAQGEKAGTLTRMGLGLSLAALATAMALCLFLAGKNVIAEDPLPDGIAFRTVQEIETVAGRLVPEAPEARPHFARQGAELCRTQAPWLLRCRQILVAEML